MKKQTAEDREPIDSNLYQQPMTDYVGFIWYWLPLLAYAGIIALLSSLSTPRIHLATLANVFLVVPSDQFTTINDKLVHITEYTILGLLTYRAIQYSWGNKLGPFSAFLTIILVAFYGVIDEIHQWFIPLRNMESMDLMADILGGLIGMSIWEWALTLPAVRLFDKQLHQTWESIKTMTATKS